MKRNAINSGLKSVKSDVLIVGCYEGALENSSTFKQLNGAGNSLLKRFAAAEDFTGKNGQTLSHFADGASGAQTVLLVGLGERNKLNLQTLRTALVKAFRAVRGMKRPGAVTFAPLSLAGTSLTHLELAETFSAYAGMLDYRINHQKTAKLRFSEPGRIESLQLITSGLSAKTRSLAGLGLHNGGAIADAVNLARNLSNEPAKDCTPQRLAAVAQSIADNSGGTITCKLHGKAELEAMGANALLQVNAGSPLDPVLIELTYTPSTGATKEVLGFVGKGITFDSGGLDLKPADGMRNMKRDMAGAAATLAAIEAVAKLQLPISVKCFVAATENMCDGKAYKPGDVIHTMGSIAVEVDNTDAEGRLTLADAIAYAKTQGVTCIVDLATLTGAVKQIGGDVAAGAFSNDDAFLAVVDKAATRADEKLQPIRMYDELRGFNDTEMADVKNSGGALAGSTTAAFFIREFVEYGGNTVPWVHLDIAGTAFRDRELGADPRGATGFGVRTLIELARSAARKNRK
ncbi:MAG TPA: leucyl aminopeptidase [Planktothrix sp.]|jgi:leucyl aminopeptidase